MFSRSSAVSPAKDCSPVLHDLVSRLPLIIIAVLLGVIFAWQTPINAEAARRLGSPVLAGVLSISLSLVLVVTFALMTVRAKPDWSEIASAPWWTWIGGIAGAVFVVAAAVIVPKTGSVLFPACRCARPDAGRHCSRHLRHVGLGGAADIADQARRCQPRPRRCSRL